MLDVSAFIPYYNAHETIRSSISSLLSGSLKPKEIVIVDDGSDKESAYALEKVVESFTTPAIRLLRHRQNRGGGAARNTACESASHDWLFCLDSDNLASRSLLRNLVEIAYSSKMENLAVAAQFLVYFKSKSGEVSHYWDFGSAGITRDRILNSPGNPNSSGNYLFDRKSFEVSGGYPTTLGSLDAFGFGFRQLISGTTMLVAQNSHYFHRLSDQSYWMRESRESEVVRALRAKSLLLESAGKITPREVSRLFRHPNQAKWFLNLGSGKQGAFGAAVISSHDMDPVKNAIMQEELGQLLIDT